MRLIEQFNSVRRASAPIVTINTPDPASTIRDIQTVHTGRPMVQWNIVDGVTSMNALANAAVTQMHTVKDPSDGSSTLMPAAMVSSNPVEALRLMKQWMPDGAIAFMHNAHFYLEQTPGDAHKPVIQAVWNLRDKWKADNKTLVLLAPHMQMPMELRNDIAMIDEPLPTEKEMEAIVKRGLDRGNASQVGRKKLLFKLTDAVLGLAPFNAEAVIAMSVNPKSRKVDMPVVWQHKIKLIEQTRGLKVHRGGVTFSDIGGNDNIKRVLTFVARGTRRPRLVVFLDEFEKSMQAAGQDTSGTTTDQQKTLLTDMQDMDWVGIMIYGFAGTGKSELAKAFGNEAGCPTVEADLGGMKNMWVGSSEANMRAFMKVIKAMGGSNVFFIATCNSVVNLPPEIKRRFRKGIFFCDLPAPRERSKIWDIYFKKFEIPQGTVKPNDEGWTGAEIRLCCENSSEFGISLQEASMYMTITSQAMGDQVSAMREAAHGKFIDAQHPGIYHYKKEQGKSLFEKLTQ